MILCSKDQMRKADASTIEEVGIPGMVLMENAAQGAARVIMEAAGDVEGLSVAALCGRGNNGGDGLAVLRILANRGADSTAYLLCSQDDLKGDAAHNLKIALACGVEVVELKDEESFQLAQSVLSLHDLYIDAMLGTGLNSEVRGRFAMAIDFLNSIEAPVLAVDIPSGLDADTGKPLGNAVLADWTVTFGLMKMGLALDSAGYVGDLALIDISIPPKVVESLDIRAGMVDQSLAEALLPVRPEDGHKGTFGHLLVVGGSPGKSGAPCLAAMGGLRAGAGLVTAAVPSGLNQVVENKLTAVMSLPLAETSQGCLATEALEVVLEQAAERQALVLGPGLSTEKESALLARELISRTSKPTVVDADGLNALAGWQKPEGLDLSHLVLTPHPGEAARLLGRDTKSIQADRPKAARELAGKFGCLVVLKGARTLIATPQGDIWVNPTGNQLLAGGGSGDVLSGIIAGLMAQGADPEDAAICGVFVHGLAAQMAAVEFGLRGLAAEELLDYLPAAFASLEVDDQEADEGHEH